MRDCVGSVRPVVSACVASATEVSNTNFSRAVHPCTKVLRAKGTARRSRFASSKFPAIAAHLNGPSRTFLTCIPLGVQCSPVLTIAVARMPKTSRSRRHQSGRSRCHGGPHFNCARLGFNQPESQIILGEAQRRFTCARNFAKIAYAKLAHAT